MAPLLIPGLSHLYQSSTISSPSVQHNGANNAHDLQSSSTSLSSNSAPGWAKYATANSSLAQATFDPVTSKASLDQISDVSLSSQAAHHPMVDEREEGELSDASEVGLVDLDDAAPQRDISARLKGKTAKKKWTKEEKRQRRLEKKNPPKKVQDATQAAEQERKKQTKKQAKQERRLQRKQLREAQELQLQAQAAAENQASKLAASPQSVSATETPQDTLPLNLAAERDKAKDFIKRWTHNGFTFQQLLEEGLDPHFLSKLYQQLNLNTVVLPTMTYTTQYSTTESLIEHSPNQDEDAERVHREKAPFEKLSSTPENVASTFVALPTAVTPDVVAPVQPPSAASALQPGQAPTTTSQTVAAANRKEYIARLLAERAKNPVASSTSAPASNVSRVPLGAAPVAVPNASNSIARDTVTADPVVMQTQHPEIAPPSSTSVVEVASDTSVTTDTMEARTQAAKRKAQTELARLRLQALASAKAALLTKAKLPASDDHQQTHVGDPANGLSTHRTFERPESIPVISMLESGSEDGELLEHTVEDQEAQMLEYDSAMSEVDKPSEPALESHLSPVATPTSPRSKTSTLPPALLPLLSGQTTPSYLPKKRLVASDFDDDGPPKKFTRRPFGEVPGVVDYQDMVIEVSDDESDVEQIEQPTLQTTAHHNGLSSNDSSLDPVSENASADEAEKLRIREEQISHMKRKILELELKRRLKASLSSRSATPATPQQPEHSVPAVSSLSISGTKDTFLVSGEGITPPSPGPETLAASATHHVAIPASASSVTIIDQLVTPTGETRVNGSNKGILVTPSTPSSSTASQADISRRQEIRHRLPQLDASFTSSQSKMALLRAQMEALQAEMLREQSEREKLQQELEGYGGESEETQNAELPAVSEPSTIQEPASESSASVGEALQPLDVNTPLVELETDDAVDAPEDHLVGTSAALSPGPPNGIVPELSDARHRSVSVESADSASSDKMSLDEDDSEPSEIMPPLHPLQQPETSNHPDSVNTIADAATTLPLPDPSSATQLDTHTTPDIATKTDSEHDGNDLEMELDSDSESDYEPPDATPLVPLPANVPAIQAQEQVVQTAQPVPSVDVLTATSHLPSLEVPNAPNENLEAPVPAPKPSFFKPYVSPLTNFKAYRYSPHYLQEVPGGLRSTTFSHAIHEQKPLCQYETLGGICNDPQCQDQHWRQMVAGDDEILRQLGTYIPGQTQEERERYIEGLKTLIIDLRSTHRTDPEVVAGKIIEYRRTFLNDPTRVLNP